MLELAPASSDEMVLSFLRAEIDSPHWSPHYLNALNALRLDRASLIDNADFTDPYANCVRAIVLGAVRGYGRNEALFGGFPSDARWRRVSLDCSDFHRLRYIGHDEFWLKLTAGTRAVLDGARAYKGSQIREPVDSVLQKIQQGIRMPELILVEDLRDGLTIVEGHTRATAYVAAGTNSVSALIGSSPSMREWAFV